MNSICVLSDALISQIAAGEVVERPASALKELIENSIDAGATKISVEIEEGGMKSISVRDNGKGIAAAELRMAFTRHATSKISAQEDLFAIQSLGFRGEALASIASISRVRMDSFAAHEEIGASIEIDGSREVFHEAFGGEKGTFVKIRDLFAHTPARRKFMKQERTEYGHCMDIFVHAALSNTVIDFRFTKDGKEILHLPKNQALSDRIRDLFGKDFAQFSLPILSMQSHLHIQGFVGQAHLSRKNKKYQFLFVNGRAVEDRNIHHAVREAFHSLLMHEQHPFYVINIEIDPSLVDVNVHPRKSEVKFVNPREIFSSVKAAVHHALEASVLTPMPLPPTSPHFAPSDLWQPPAPNFTAPQNFHQQSFAVPQSPATQIHMEAEAEIINLQGTYLRPLAQVARSYIVAESEEGLVLIDQHAAHERVRYAKFMEDLEAGPKCESQMLLTPLEIEVGSQGMRFFQKYANDFSDFGFEIEEFGPVSLLLRAVPKGLEHKNPEQIVQEFISDAGGKAVDDLREALLTMSACRGAIKFGDKLSLQEMEALLKDMGKSENCTHCPHGRPAILTLSFDQLEIMFKRKNF